MKFHYFVLGAGLLSLGACGSSSQIVEPKDLNNQRVFFAFDSSEITEESRNNLLGQSLYLKNHGDVKVQIQGNTDERGTQAYNLALGARRANAAKSVIVKDGVDAKRISTISFGKERPIAKGSNETAWKQNRNATTVVK
jgi:peptidoglycan-associated lipoprotein